jgi:hypothetical protein
LLATGEFAGRLLDLSESPTRSRINGTWDSTVERGTSDHFEREGHVLEDRLVRQESKVLEHAADVAPQERHAELGQSSVSSRPASSMRPLSGNSSRKKRRRKVVLPEPDAPTKKTNSPFSMSSVMSFRAGEPFL